VFGIGIHTSGGEEKYGGGDDDVDVFAIEREKKDPHKQ
jgi:hypothetical protein